MNLVTTGAIASSLQGVFDPMSLSPVLFVNPYKDLYVSTVDNNGVRAKGNIINSATASTGQTLNTLGTLGSKPINNGEGWYFKTNSQLTTGAVSDYNFIHNGSDFEVWCTIFLCPTSTASAGRAYITNNGFATSARGILLRSVKTAGNTTIQCNVGNGTGAMINLTSSIVAENATYTVRIVRLANNAKMYINGVLQGTGQTISLANGVGDAQTMTIGSTLSSTANIYLKDIVIFNRALSAGEVTKMNSRTFASIPIIDINAQIEVGDSNCAGRGTNSAIASDLLGAINGSYAMAFNSNVPTHLSYISKLQLGVNNTLIAQSLGTQHGSEMRFGKEMGALKDTLTIKYGVGSTFAYYDWLVTNSNLAYSNSLIAIREALSDLVHVYRRNPVFRGISWEQGANDAYIGGDNVSWTRSGTTITVVKNNHTIQANHVVPFTFSSDPAVFTEGLKAVTIVNSNTFTIQGNNAGATSGTLSYSAGSTYGANIGNLFVAYVNYLTNTIQNQVTGGTGYTVNKMRIYISRTKAVPNGNTTFSQTSYNNQIAGVQSLVTNFFTTYPAMVGKVQGLFSESTDDVSVQVDFVHLDTPGYDTVGNRRAAYFNPFRNE